MEAYVKEQLAQPNLNRFPFGAKGNGITYANMMAIKKIWKMLVWKGLTLQLALTEAIQMDNLLLALLA